MTNLEFSREFDILYNNITSNQAPSLNSYEKSVFLTEAEEQYQQELVDGIGGKDNNRVLAILNPFITRRVYTSVDFETDGFPFEKRGVNSVSLVSEDKDDVLVILRESAMCHDENCATHPCNIYPVKEDEVNHILLNPFRFNKNIVLRVDEYGNSGSRYRRALIYKGTLDSYTIIYVRPCKPIVLFDEDNDFDLSVNDIGYETPCEFPAHEHRKILELAVLRAKAAWDSAEKQSIN